MVSRVALCSFFVCFLVLKGITAKRCHISQIFQRYCGKHSIWYDITAQQCADKCDKITDCLVATWHPPKQIWSHVNRNVCFWFRVTDKTLKVCDWGKNALIEAHPGAKMIRCSKTQNNEIERCYIDLKNFKRHCGAEVPGSRLYGESSERCRQICNDNAACHVAHWHPAKQIWETGPLSETSVCFMFPIGTEVCQWRGYENIGKHPGAQMIRCKQPRIISFEYDVDNVRLLSNTPQVLGKIVVSNQCLKEYIDRCPVQSKKLEVSKTTSSSKSWTHEAGVSVTVGTEFKTGVPVFAEGKLKVETTTSYTHTWGKTETETKSWTVSDQCTSPPGATTTCEFFVTKRRTDVPFKILWSTGQYTHGVYRDVDFFYGGTTVTYTFHNKKRSLADVPIPFFAQKEKELE